MRAAFNASRIALAIVAMGASMSASAKAYDNDPPEPPPPPPVPMMVPLACKVPNEAGCVTVWGGRIDPATGVAVGVPLFGYPRFPDYPPGAATQLAGSGIALTGIATADPVLAAVGVIVGAIGTMQGAAAAMPQVGERTVTMFPGSGFTGTATVRLGLSPGDLRGSWLFPDNPGGPGCVHVDSLLPDGRRAGDIKVGDTIQLGQEDTLETRVGVVTYSESVMQPGYRLTTRSGVSLVCSASAPVAVEGGGFMHPADLKGHRVAVRVDGARDMTTSYEEVEVVAELGQIEVQHITVGDRAFWAREARSAGYLLHHNKTDCSAGCYDP